VERYMPLPFRTYFPFKVPPAGIAGPFRDRWLPRRSVCAAFECGDYRSLDRRVP